MENKTISHLNSTAWYRLIKVLYIAIFISIFIFGAMRFFRSFTTHNVVSLSKTSIDCKLGVQKNVNVETAGITTQDNFWNINTLQRACQITPTELTQAENTWQEQQDKVCAAEGDSFAQGLCKALDANPTDFEQNLQNQQLIVYPIYQTTHNWEKILTDAVILLLGLVLLFEILKRLFYYIVLGNFFVKS